jgi:hypothetical protein
MRIREMRLDGLYIWPPQWAWRQLPDKGVLNNVKVITRTGLLKIDVYYEGEPLVGIIFAETKDIKSLYNKLKDNIGKCLSEVGDLEIDR